MTADQHKSRKELLAELEQARQKIAALESAQARRADRGAVSARAEPSQGRQEWFQTLFEELPDAIVISTLDDHIVEANDAACRMLGYSREELVELSIPDIQAPESRGRPGTVIWTELDCGQTFEGLDLHRNGRRIPVEVMTKRVLFEGRELALSIVRDISERKTAEKTLQESEKRYRDLYECAPLGIFQSTPGDRYVHVNPTFARMYGFASPEEVVREVGSISRDLYVNPDDRDTLLAILGERGSVENYELCGRLRSGSTIWVSLNMREVRDASGRVSHYDGFLTDITQRKQAEETLQEYVHVIRATKDFMAVLDEDRRYTMVNDSLLLSRGLERNEVIGSFIWDVVGREVYEASLRAPLDLCYQGQGQQIEVAFAFPSQGERALEIKLSPVHDAEGRVFRVAMVASDITERKKSEDALLRSEEKYRTILENMDEAYFELDLAGNLVFFNEALRRNLGYSREELMGMNNRDYTRPEMWRQMYEIFQKIYVTGQPARINDYEVVAKDGRVIAAEASADLIRDESGAPIGFRGLARDVTERKKSEQERQKLEAQLIQAQKMEAIGTLAGGIAHDFNNILQSLKGNIQLWLRKVEDSDPSRKYLDRMNTMTDRATELVRGLLTFSRTSSPQELKPVDLNLLIAETVEILKRTVPKMIEIHTRLEADRAWIKGESTQLQQVLMNLVSNARDAIHPQETGDIRIQTENLRIDGEQGLNDPPSGEYILIRVADSGSGMDQQTLEHIFEPFFSTKEVGQGTGLGLAMVYGIVQTHQAFIECTSQVGAGTEFTITIPLLQLKEGPGGPAATGTDPDTSSQSALRQSPRRILLVDDEAAVREVTQEWLEEKGFEVTSVKSGEDALAWFEEDHAFDVVLLDLNMPGMGGEATMKALLKRHPELKIIVVSGYGEHTLTRGRILSGAAAFLTKPFTMEGLLASINQILQA